MRKELLFLNVTNSKTVVYLPKSFDGRIIGARITHWDIQGIPYLLGGGGEVLSPHYIQIKFSDGLVSEVYSNSSSPTMIPVPVLQWEGSAPHQNIYPLPISLRKTLGQRFIFELFDEGQSPSYLTFNRATFWIELDLEN